jgi:hypothetical protein
MRDTPSGSTYGILTYPYHVPNGPTGGRTTVIFVGKPQRVKPPSRVWQSSDSATLYSISGSFDSRMRRASPGDFSRHKSGVQWCLPMLCRRGSPRAAWESGVAICARRNLTRDIQAPLRQGRVGPLTALVTRDRFLESHWTPDLCLRKSRGAAACGVTACVYARFGRMNMISFPRIGLRIFSGRDTRR